MVLELKKDDLEFNYFKTIWLLERAERQRKEIAKKKAYISFHPLSQT